MHPLKERNTSVVASTRIPDVSSPFRILAPKIYKMSTTRFPFEMKTSCSPRLSLMNGNLGADYSCTVLPNAPKLSVFPTQDRGACSMSSEVTNFLQSRGIVTSRSTPYNTRGNGQCGRFERQLPWHSEINSCRIVGSRCSLMSCTLYGRCYARRPTVRPMSVCSTMIGDRLPSGSSISN